MFFLKKVLNFIFGLILPKDSNLVHNGLLTSLVATVGMVAITVHIGTTLLPLWRPLACLAHEYNFSHDIAILYPEIAPMAMFSMLPH